MGDFVKIRIEDSLTKDGDKFTGRLDAISRRSVGVGFFGGRHYIKENGEDVDFVTIAARHEFGTVNQRRANKYELGGQDNLMPNGRMAIAADVMEENKGKIISLAEKYLEGNAPLDGILDNIGKWSRDVMRSIFKRHPTFSPKTESEYRKAVDKGFRTNVEYEIQEK